MRARLAALAAKVAPLAGRSLRNAPGVLGAGCVVVFLGLVWAPLAWLGVGVFLLLIDQQVKP